MSYPKSRERQNRIIPAGIKIKNHERKNHQQDQADPGSKNSARIFMNDFSGEELKQALTGIQSNCVPLEEMANTAQAAFTFIRLSTLDDETKDAIWQLEKQFDFYKNLIN